MWKVERTCSFGFIGEDEFNSFDSAKIEFRNIIKNKHQDSIKHFIDVIDKYCKEFYPNGAPEQILKAKEIVYKIVTNPEFLIGAPELEHQFMFSDDNIEITFLGNILNIHPAGTFDEDLDENWEENFKFVVAEINATDFYDPDVEYYFYIDDKKDHEINIALYNADAEANEDD